MRLFVGLDIGSSFVKALVFDERGHVRGAATRGVPVRFPQPGFVERDAEAVWRAAATVVRCAVGRRAAAVRAVGLTGCGNGAVFLDAAGRPLRAGVMASDSRAEKYLGSARYPGQTAVLLRWLRASEPSDARRLHRVLFWKDFVRLRLTGEAFTDPTDLGAAGFPRGSDPVLPPVRPSLSSAGAITRVAASRTGLRVGTPVIVGCIDCEAAAIGSGVSGPGELSLVAGTWSINQAFVTAPPRRRDHFLVNPSAQPGRWLVLEGSPSSASHFDWFVRAVTGRADFTRMAALAAKASVGELLFVPRLYTDRAVFFGLGVRHDHGAMARAVMEGVCFAHRSQVEKLRTAEVRCTTARLAGGAARSPFWCQLFADVLGLRIEVPGVAEPGAFGAALIAGVGVNDWPSLAAAQAATLPRSRSFEPVPTARRAYDRAYARFQKLCALSLP